MLAYYTLSIEITFVNIINVKEKSFKSFKNVKLIVIDSSFEKKIFESLNFYHQQHCQLFSLKWYFAEILFKKINLGISNHSLSVTLSNKRVYGSQK